MSCNIFECIFRTLEYTTCMFSDCLTSLTAYIQNVLVSCLNERSSFHYRTIQPSGGISDSTAVLALGFCFLIYLQCTNTGGIPPHTSLLVTHLSCLPQFSETGRCGAESLDQPAYGIDHCVSSATTSCPSIKRILLYGYCAPLRFAV